MGYNPFMSFYAGILRDTLHQDTGPTATRKLLLIVLRIIGRRGFFARDGRNKVKVSLFLAMRPHRSRKPAGGREGGQPPGDAPRRPPRPLGTLVEKVMRKFLFVFFYYFTS
jgi:hypothetical protein